MSSLYIHVPFCRSKCGYCSFSSWPGLEAIHERYVRAVLCELAELAKSFSGEKLSTIFFGGGTPSLLPAHQLEILLERAATLFGLEDGAEISLEANPGTIDNVRLAELRKSGFSRLSLGVQSFLDNDLRGLGRCHTSAEAIAAFHDARSAGFENISMDLMYGLPRQTVGGWRNNLDLMLTLRPEHLSMYQLTIEENTRFAELETRGELQLPSEEAIIAMDEMNLELCRAAGYDCYEVSNYARPGYRCRHNLNYWQNGEYLAAGAGAVSYLHGVRQRRVDDPVEYISRLESGVNPVVESEKLPLEERFRETVIMGLRLTEGVELRRLQACFNMEPLSYYGPTLQNLLAEGLMECSASHLRVSDKGRLLSNAILAELV